MTVNVETQAAKWEPPNLAQISETADVDEDHEQESSAENITSTSPPK